jgi:hypothetical protein
MDENIGYIEGRCEISDKEHEYLNEAEETTLRPASVASYHLSVEMAGVQRMMKDEKLELETPPAPHKSFKCMSCGKDILIFKDKKTGDRYSDHKCHWKPIC